MPIQSHYTYIECLLFSRNCFRLQTLDDKEDGPSLQGDTNILLVKGDNKPSQNSSFNYNYCKYHKEIVHNRENSFGLGGIEEVF